MNAAVETIAEIPRDRFGRPLIIPPHGGKPIPYTRCTTYIGALEDTYNLGQWQMRMVAAGVAATPGLPTRLAALGLEPTSDPEKREWKENIGPLVDEAMETAKAKDKARHGTEFHQITENFERTGDLTDVPAEWAPNLDAFIEATKGLKSMAIEQFLVNDEHQVGGTADRVYQIAGVEGYVIGDLKTGNTTYGIGKIAMQLCMYAHSQMYDLATGVRTPIPGLRTDFGIVMDHDIPSATCRLIRVDLQPAWDAIQVAKQVRAWRSFAKPKNLVKPWVAPQIDAIVASLDAAIASATSRDEISQLWQSANQAGTWTPTHTAAAQQRIAALETAASAA